MRPVAITLLLLSLGISLLAPSGVYAELCAEDDEHRSRLFAGLDLSRDDLREVRQAVAKRAWPEACRALLMHYRRNTPPGRDVGEIAANPRAVAEADKILADTFTFLNTEGRVPRLGNGRMNWHHRGPHDDREWASYLNRFMYLRTLAAAYRATGKTAYVSYIDQHIRDWVLSNPYPGKRSKDPDMGWLSLEPANRAIIWSEIFYGLREVEALTPETRILLLSSILDHANFLHNYHSSLGNHLPREMEALATIAVSWPELAQAEEWLRYSLKQIDEWSAHQFYPDGVNRELSAFYQRFIVRRLRGYEEITDNSEARLPDGLNHILRPATNYLAYSMRPDGSLPLNNDGDPVYHRKDLMAAAEAHGRSDWAYIASHGRIGEAPDGPPSAFFPWAGQLIMRSGWDEDAHWAFFDFGPWGIGSHQHSDKLHLSVSAFGRNLLVDAGRYTYDRRSLWRNYFSGSASHNVILIDGSGQKPTLREAEEPIDPGSVALTPAFDYARGTFSDGFEQTDGQAIHTRAVFYSRGRFWVVVDRILTDRPRKIDALWHYHPDCSVEIDRQAVVSTDPGSGNLRIVPVGDLRWKVNLVRGQTEPRIQGWWSEGYGRKQPSYTAIYSASIERSKTFGWLLVPARGEVPELRVEVLAANEDGMRLRVRTSEGPYEVTAPLSGGEPSVGFTNQSSDQEKVPDSPISP